MSKEKTTVLDTPDEAAFSFAMEAYFTNTLFDAKGESLSDRSAYVRAVDCNFTLNSATNCFGITPERLEKIKAVLDKRTDYCVPVLDNVYDPYNFAAVLRSCEAFGLQEVHIITTSEKFELERKISKGCERWLDLKFWHSHKECFDFLRQEGRLIVATALPKDGETAFPLPELPLDKPLAIIFGNEHRGVGEESLAECDLKAFLPMYGFVESLNISAAFAASLGALLPRLRKEQPNCALSEAKKAEILSRWLENEPKRTTTI